MSDIKECGGSAFPTSNAPGYFNSNGMTLRDYFAAKAMQGLLACSIQPQSGVDMYAKDAYLIADAMLSARVK